METEPALRAVGVATVELHRAQQVLQESVVAAREAGATWSEIGDATGMSRQSAHERWGHIPRAGCRRQGCDCPNHLAADCLCGHGPGRGYRINRSPGSVDAEAPA